MPDELNPRSEAISAEVRAEMGRQQVSMNELAEATCIPVSTLRRSVIGKRPFNTDELHDIAERLNISVVSLIQNARREHVLEKSS